MDKILGDVKDPLALLGLTHYPRQKKCSNFFVKFRTVVVLSKRMNRIRTDFLIAIPFSVTRPEKLVDLSTRRMQWRKYV